MFKKCASYFIIIALLIHIFFPDISVALAQTDEDTPKIAVFSFTDANAAAKKDGYGAAISGMLMTELINGRVFQVIERSEIERIMNEMAFQISGAVDSRTAKRLGEVLGVDILVFGSVAKFDPIVETDIRLIDTQSGEALLAENASSESGVEIRNMVQNLARKIENRFIGRLTEDVLIQSDPPGAIVYIDGVKEGITPLTKSLSQGTHKVRITTHNYDVWERTVNVVPGGGRIKAELKPAMAEKSEPDKTARRDQDTDRRVTYKKTSAGSNTWLWIVGGVVVVGGAIAALVLLSGDEDENSDVSVTVEFP